MTYTKKQLWERFQKNYAEFPPIGLAIDISRMNFSDDYFDSMELHIQQAFSAMNALEKGAIANPDEHRMVGHYWLRNPNLAPTAAIRHEIETTWAAIKRFAARVHSGEVKGAGGAFQHLLLIGIGGSALGPQFVSSALGQPSEDRLKIHFIDNTDPDGIDRVLAELASALNNTLCLVISKSGGTKETRNGMLEVQSAFTHAGIEFPKQAVAITESGSALHKLSLSQNWLERFPMWDWVGGRTSELSAVGLLPAALQGFDIDAMIAGAKACDELTRRSETRLNPAAILALMWFYIGNGKGDNNMVVLPYKDRLELLSKYLQQLIMESLGKEFDVNRNQVNQGISVFGNKGSTDQHSYVQQLRDGLCNFFVTFIEVLQDRTFVSSMVEEKVTSGDFLVSFLQGTRNALYEKDRESITITIKKVSPFSIGVLIALFERTVGLYASLIHVNAYHQPGVEAGKKAAATIIDMQVRILELLSKNPRTQMTAKQIAEGINLGDDAECVFKICEHLAANPDRGIKKSSGDHLTRSTYQFV